MQCDILIIGSGPSGLQSAIHCSRAKVKTIVLGKLKGALQKAEVENYFGIEEINGIEMLKIGKRQAEKFGTEFIEEDVVKIWTENKPDVAMEKEIGNKENKFFVETENGKIIESKALIFAIGVSRKKLNVKGEEQFFGSGVSYCAECDCRFFKGKDVVVVGEESSAIHGALLLKEYAKKVYLIGKVKDERLKDIEIMNKKVIEIFGDEFVKGVKFSDNSILNVDGVFIELGAKGVIELGLSLGISLNDDGYIVVDRDMRTNINGVFACGDITGKPLQLAKAVGEGCVAGMNAVRYVKGLR